MWNARLLDFALRVGFDPQLCRAYRAQTKGKVRLGHARPKGAEDQFEHFAKL